MIKNHSFIIKTNIVGQIKANVIKTQLIIKAYMTGQIKANVAEKHEEPWPYNQSKCSKGASAKLYTMGERKP